MSNSATYLTVAAVRIQSWLSRCPDLKGRRGASALLSEHTDGARLAAALRKRFPSAVINPDAPKVDGVVELIHNEQNAGGVAQAALNVLAGGIPGIELEAAWVVAESYDKALVDLLAGGNPDGRLRTLAIVAEVPVFARCSVTGLDTAVTTQHMGNDTTRRIGLDAAARIDAAGRRTSTRRADANAPGLDAEHRLAERLGCEAEPDDFDELASLGPGPGKRNHLATVFIDGNSVGEAFRRRPSAERGVLSQRVKAATEEALYAASASVIRDPGGMLPVIPHVVGGDDVLVSLPARMAVPFTRMFLQVFGDRLEGAELSASAGVVFAHSSHPFNTVVGVADDLLAKAKADHGGRCSAIAFAELTIESAEPVRLARSWKLTDLDAYALDLDLLVATGKSTRHELMRAATEPDPMVASAMLARQLDRSRLSNAFVRASASDPSTFAELLRLARWWAKGGGE